MIATNGCKTRGFHKFIMFKSSRKPSIFFVSSLCINKSEVDLGIKGCAVLKVLYFMI